MGDAAHPHLIKLQDATQYQLPVWYDVLSGDYEVDQSVFDLPHTMLCTSEAGNKPRFGTPGGAVGYCANANAPGFYAVMWYDSVALKFRFLSNPGKDYVSTTPFYVYTTTGYLQSVSHIDARVFTSMNWNSVHAKAASFHSNMLYMTNITATYTNYFGDLACETQTVGTHGLSDCIHKNDMVMVLNSDTVVPAHNAVNPAYPNIYTVVKISNEEKVYSSIFSNSTNEQHRLQIQLDYGLNVDFRLPLNPTTIDTLATIYKFYPMNPAKTNADGGYGYAGACSNRGNCNYDAGLCECYNGFTGDNCNALNALAK